MLPVVVLSLFGGVLAVGVLFTWAFVEVGFRQSPPVIARPPVASFRPPIISGGELRNWAARIARTLTLQVLSEPRSDHTAARIATVIGEGTTEAIAAAKGEVVADGDNACPSPSCGHRMITATAAEVLAIADAVHQLGHRTANRVRHRAERNAKRAAHVTPLEYKAADIICPLMTSDGHCLTHGVRPLQCRAWCKLCDSDGANCLLADEANAHTVSQGVRQGLGAALDDAGLDSRAFELNGALAVALTQPEAALQWAVGETVFEGCREA